MPATAPLCPDDAHQLKGVCELHGVRGATLQRRLAKMKEEGPARSGDVLTAEARVRSRYGRNGIYDVTVALGDRVIAEFRGRSSQVREPRP